MKKQFIGYSIKETDALLEVLRKENEDLQKQISQMENELSHANEEIAGYKTASEKLYDEEVFLQNEALIETLRTENEDLQKQISKMEDELSHANEEIASYKTASEKLYDEEAFLQNEALIETLKTENEDLQKQISEMEDELLRANEEIDTYNTISEKLHNEEIISQNEALIGTLRTENDDLKQQISEMQSELTRMKEESEKGEAASEQSYETEACYSIETNETCGSSETSKACDTIGEELTEETVIDASEYDNSTVQIKYGSVYMNTKINELKAEKERNLQKIAEITAQNKEIDLQITKLENADIIDIVRENGITPEQLHKLILSFKNSSDNSD